MKKKKNIILGTVVLMVLMAFAGSAQAAIITVDDSGGADHTTITDAITAANNGDTIIVAAGIYTNDIWNSSVGAPAGYRITKSITLLGANAGVDPAGSTDRGGETILVRTNGLPYSLYAPNITIDGFMFGSSYPNTGGRLIISDVADNAIIRNCIIQNAPDLWAGHGVYIYSGADNALVEHNTFYNTAWEAIRCDGAAVISGNTITDIPTNKGIYLGANSDAQVIDNVITNTFYEGIQACGIAEITNNDISGCYIGIQIRDSAVGTIIDGNNIHGNTYEGIQALVSVEITDNDISGCYKAIQIQDSATGTIIDGNNIHDNQYWGVSIESGVTVATVTNNQFVNNPYCGVTVWGDGDGSGIHINCNEIIGNGIYGVESQRTTSNVDAENNWWGDASGPSGVGSGTGDIVSRNVDYDPWLTYDQLTSSLTCIVPPQPTTAVVLEATLADSTSIGISGVEVYFYLNGNGVGSATTDTNGVAILDSTTYLVGVYDIFAAVNCLESEHALLAVYDPSAGFVTGGGWIDSPEGAYYPDTSLAGKANFGFVSKYKKGTDTPTGTTQFKFKVADLKFHSESYDWLVIAGEHAKYKGTGTINGEGEYDFMLTATDGDFLGTSGSDTFRIKIWDKATETVVYDNKPGLDDTEYDGTELGGGSIVIHKAK